MRKMLKQILTKLKNGYATFCKHSAIHYEAELYKPNSKIPRKN